MTVSTRNLYIQGKCSIPTLIGFPTVPLESCGPWVEVGESLFLKWIPLKLPVSGNKKFKIIPSCSALTEGSYSFRFALMSGNAGPEQLPVTLLDSVGEKEISNGDVAGALKVDKQNVVEEPNIDFYETEGNHPRLALSIKIPDSSQIEIVTVLAAVTVISSAGSNATTPVQDGLVSPLPVPRLSQMQHGGKIARRICSATNVAMIVQYYRRSNIELRSLADLTYSSKQDLYGVWPHSIWAASRSGVLGMITNINSWEEVANTLEAGMPIVATITYEAGELRGAAIESSSGHLVTIVGLEPNKVIVNDPAASTDGEVRRTYDLKEFGRAWFGRKSGICYVFFQPA